MIRELLSPETGLAFSAMQALRTDLTDEGSFVQRVEEIQRPEGYRLVGVFEEGETSPCAVGGFRTGHSLALGHYLYVDDLSTLPEDQAARAWATAARLASRGGWATRLRANSSRLWRQL